MYSVHQMEIHRYMYVDKETVRFHIEEPAINSCLAPYRKVNKTMILGMTCLRLVRCYVKVYGRRAMLWTGTKDTLLLCMKTLYTGCHKSPARVPELSSVLIMESDGQNNVSHDRYLKKLKLRPVRDLQVESFRDTQHVLCLWVLLEIEISVLI